MLNWPLCENCLRPYTSKSRIPNTLPANCGHTICKDCSNTRRANGDVSCPVCSKDVDEFTEEGFGVNQHVLVNRVIKEEAHSPKA